MTCRSAGAPAPRGNGKEGEGRAAVAFGRSGKAAPPHAALEKTIAEISLRLPEALLATLRERAKERGISFQRFVRETLEASLR